MSNEDLFAATIAALQNVDNETERTYLAGQLLGRGATELGALLNMSAEETEEMRQRVHELGGVMSEEAVKASAAYQDSLQDMQTAFSGLSRGMLVEFLPGITGVMDGLTEIFSGNSSEGIGMISAGVASVVDTISGLMPEFLKLGSSIIVSLAQAITDNLPTLLSSGADAVITIAEGLIAQLPDIIATGFDVIVSLAKGIADNLPTLIPTVVDVVLEIVDTLTDPKNLGNLIDAAIAIMLALTNGLIDALPKLVERVPEIITHIVDTLIENLPKLLKASVRIIGQLAQGLIENLPLLFNAAGKIVGEIVAGIFEVIQNLWDAGKEAVNQVWEGLTSLDPLQWGRDLIENFVSGITEKWERIKGGVSGIAQTIKDLLGFSEPKEGPLSDFHTYAPDMMELFAKGIRDNEHLITDQIEDSFGLGAEALNAWEIDRVNSAIAGAGSYRFGGRNAAAADGGGISTRDIAEALTAALLGIGVYMDGQTVGRLVTRAQMNTARAYG